jgi:hypothetical protein
MTNYQKGLSKEKKDQKRFGAKGTPRSGGLWFAKGDNKTKCFLIENKKTDAESFSVKLKIFNKIEREAIIESRIPVLSVELGKEKKELVVLSVEDFETLIHDHSSTTEIYCEEHNGRLILFDNCQFNCVQHECNGKTWAESDI